MTLGLWSGKVSIEGQQNRVLKNQGVPHKPSWQSKESAQRLELGRVWAVEDEVGGQIHSEGLEVSPKREARFVRS